MKLAHILIATLCIWAAATCELQAQGVSLFADQAFHSVLQEILPQFTDQTGFEVELSVGQTTILSDRIRSGIPADVFFPATEEAMRQMMSKGMVDVALKRNILILPGLKDPGQDVEPEPQYISAAVLNESQNRLQAKALLDFLTSQPAREAFAAQGFALP